MNAIVVSILIVCPISFVFGFYFGIRCAAQAIKNGKVDSAVIARYEVIKKRR